MDAAARFRKAPRGSARRALTATALTLAGLLPAAVAHAVPMNEPPPFVNEVQYLEFAINHHFSALRITELAAGTAAVGSTSNFAGAPDIFPATPAKATDPVALQVATMANAGQRREIVEGQDFLRTYYGISNYTPTLQPSLAPVVSYLDAAAAGDTFNVAFLEAFSGHHATLTPPSQQCETLAPHADVRAYCTGIADTQTMEISQMRIELANVYGITSIPYETIPVPNNGAFPSAGTGGTAVPEPASAALLAAGLLGLGVALRGRQAARSAG